MVDVNAHFPDILKEVKEFQGISKAENPELLFLLDELEKTMDDQFIETATQTGVARREKMLRISPMGSDTLEERKFRLLARYNENLPYTLRALHSQMTILCGEKGYRLEFHYGAFTLKAKLELTSKKNVGAVEDMLERILPVNMLFGVELLYNQHQMLKRLTHAEMRNITHLDLREEVLNND